MATERPAKRVKLLAEDSDSDSDASGGIRLDNDAGFKVNQEFAKRYEHNEKRKERHRLEEKYGNQDEESDESSTDEEEDDEAQLASGALDDQFQATLKALRSKDPSIYKKDIKFYEDEDEEEEEAEANGSAEPQEKPMYLTDYHRQNLLNGKAGQEDEEDAKPSFAQEQESIRKSVIKEMHGGDDSDEDMEDGDFLIKSRVEVPEPATNGKATTTATVSARDDPDAFLDDFLSRRAWVPTDKSNIHAFESDDEDFDRRAEDFEHAYNLRFEDPDANKGKLISHARDITDKYSVRQEAKTGRQRTRETEKEKREAIKQEREQDKARLKKLKLDEAEEKLRKIKETAGLRGKEFDMDEWSEFLTGDWDDKQWEKEFEKRFGEDYYNEDDARGGDDDEDEDDEGDVKKKKKPKKPKFDDDIDITDLVPDFEADENAQFSITDDEAGPGAEDDDADADADGPSNKKTKSKVNKKDKEKAKRESRRERRKLEALVDEQMDTELALESATRAGKRKAEALSMFRYRETSPTAFGLSATEILMASDSQLNSLVGLKKLATFRDEAKKRKDKKHLGKKARLRQWRKDTFGNEQGPTKTLQDILQDGGDE